MLVAQSCPTVCNPMDCSRPGSSVHEIFQASILEWAAILSFRGSFLIHGSSPGLLHCRQILYHLGHQESPRECMIGKSFSRVRLFVTPWATALQASLSTTNSWNLLKLMSIKSVMPSNHLIFCQNVGIYAADTTLMAEVRLLSRV